jgi:hypothetical protein
MTEPRTPSSTSRSYRTPALLRANSGARSAQPRNLPAVHGLVGESAGSAGPFRPHPTKGISRQHPLPGSSAALTVSRIKAAVAATSPSRNDSWRLTPRMPSTAGHREPLVRSGGVRMRRGVHSGLSNARVAAGCPQARVGYALPVSPSPGDTAGSRVLPTAIGLRLRVRQWASRARDSCSSIWPLRLQLRPRCPRPVRADWRGSDRGAALARLSGIACGVRAGRVLPAE